MAAQNLSVAHIEAAPGTSARGRIVVGTEQDGTELALPVLTIHGATPGPTVYLGALIHGNEPSGAEVIRRVMREAVDPTKLSGSLIAIPIQNPLAFRTSTYHSLEDGLNANRIFPGDATETLTNRCVAAISKYALDQSQYVLDLHCNARDSILYNFVRWNDSDAGNQSVELSKAFGFTTVISEAKRHGFGFEERLVGLLADTSLAQGKPTLTVELTPSYDFSKPVIDGGVRGVLNVLRKIGMLEGPIEPQTGLPIIDKVLGPQLRVTPEHGGFLHPVERVGAQVTKGQTLVLVRDPWGDVIDEVKSPADGYVLSFPHHGNQSASSGDVVAFVGPVHATIS
jgi:predicted deacylase